MKTVAIVCGGYSKEEAISIKSAEQISKSIDTSEYQVYNVLITKEKWVAKIDGGNRLIDKNDFSFLHNGEKVVFDAVFMAIHGTPGEDGKLQAYFNMLDIPVTTCNTFVSALTFNKYATKVYLENFGVLTAKAMVVRNNRSYNNQEIVDRLGLPMFVKPNNGGSSFGITKVKEALELPQALKKAFVEDPEVIIEEFVQGREFTCGVFVSDEHEIVLPITEIVSKTEFFDFKAKYEGLSDEITPARLSDQQTKECQRLTYDIYKLLNCRGVVRIDFLLRGNSFYFMEVNTVPGMSSESIIPKQVDAAGLGITNFYSLLIEDAIKRTKH